MLTASVQFASKVGVAPSTTTLVLDGANPLGGCDPLGIQCRPVPESRDVEAVARKRPSPKDPWRYYMPYATPSDLRYFNGGNGGLGLINESDAWLTGRPYGLPGTTALRINKQDDGHYRTDLIGADMMGLNDLGQDVSGLTEIMRQFLEVQKAQQKAISRIAFWTALGGGIAAGTLVVAVVAGVMTAGRMNKARKTQEA
jgi:hypothetical protein